MPNEAVTIIHNPVVARVIGADKKLRYEIADMISYQITSANPDHNDRSSFYKFRTDTFPAGFVRLVKKRLERAGYTVIIKSKPAPEPLGPENPKVDDFPEDPRYYFQPKIVERLLYLKGMIARVATGGGKSRIFKLCAERINRPTLFVTTRKTLMYQMANNYKDSIKKPYGVIGDGEYSPLESGVTFAIVATLALRLQGGDMSDEIRKLSEDFIVKREVVIDRALSKAGLPLDLSVTPNPPESLRKAIRAIRDPLLERYPLPKEKIKILAKEKFDKKELLRVETERFLAGVEFVCLEEAHEVSSESYFSIVTACKNAHYRLALTGSPFMKDDEESNMRLMAATGPVGIAISEKELIDSGILATPIFRYARYAAPMGVMKTTAWQRAYTKGIVENKARNDIVVRECQMAAKFGLPAMILVQHTKHGNILKKMLAAAGLSVNFISGESNQAKREKELARLKSGSLNVLIGSTILDVGVDVPAVGLVVLAGAGKAEEGLRQRVGRGLREKKVGPNFAFVLDFEDVCNKHLSEHFRQRQSIIKATPGFAENIVLAFDPTKYGFKAA